MSRSLCSCTSRAVQWCWWCEAGQREDRAGGGDKCSTRSLDAFGRSLGGWGNPTVNPYRYGAAWGYATDTPGSGLLLLGARTYWPEVGRFLQQDPLLDGENWWAYAGDNPVVGVDPEGLKFAVRGDKAAFDAALAYLRQVPWMAAIISGMEGSSTVFKVQTGDFANTYCPADRKVFWDPHRGVKTTSGGKQSPALSLAHGLGHALMPPAWNWKLDDLRLPNAFDTVAEFRNIALFELPLALALGEGIRTDHRGAWLFDQPTVPR